jgi:hypothetical protein
MVILHYLNNKYNIFVYDLITYISLLRLHNVESNDFQSFSAVKPLGHFYSEHFPANNSSKYNYDNNNYYFIYLENFTRRKIFKSYTVK